jgi:hypothetical protein
MKKIVFAICLFCVSALAMHGTGENPPQTVTDLWDKMLQAKGVSGSPIRTFVLFLKARSGSAFENDNSGIERRTIVSSPPDGWWIFNDFSPGKLGASVAVYDLPSHKAWIRYVDVGDKDAPQSTDPNTPGAQQGREMILAAFFCQTPGFTPQLIEARPAVQQGVHTYDIVKASWNDELTYYLDRSTHLPEKLEIVIKGKTTVPAYRERPARTISYSDTTWIVMEAYQEVNGIKIPKRVKIRDSWYDVSVQINVDLPQNLFRDPPIGVTSGEDWKQHEH